MATPTEPPTHPLFAYQHSSKAKPSHLQPSELNSFSPSSNSYLLLPPYNPLQMFSAFTSPYNPTNILEQTLTSSALTIPTISEFLKQVDEMEGTNNYYQSLLIKLEQQRISVRILSKLTDEDFEKCGVDTIGARQTLRDYAMKYNNTSSYNPTPFKIPM